MLSQGTFFFFFFVMTGTSPFWQRGWTCIFEYARRLGIWHPASHGNRRLGYWRDGWRNRSSYFMCLCIFLPRSSPCVTRAGFVHHVADVLVLLGSGRRHPRVTELSFWWQCVTVKRFKWTWNGKIIVEVTLKLNKLLDWLKIFIHKSKKRKKRKKIQLVGCVFPHFLTNKTPRCRGPKCGRLCNGTNDSLAPRAAFPTLHPRSAVT